MKLVNFCENVFTYIHLHRAASYLLDINWSFTETSPIAANRRPLPGESESAVVGSAVVGSAVSSDSVGVLPLVEVDEPLVQLQINEQVTKGSSIP